MMLLKFILGLVPIIWLIIALSAMKMPGYKACSIAIVLSAVVAIFYKGMRPVDTASAFLEGVLSALWPIILVIIAALFTYNLTLETGAMEKIKKMLTGVSTDKRILALIIGWGFGCFMEGMAGFGTAVAIPASILIALGYEPVSTVVALLIVNSTPTAFGSVGVPTTSVASATGLAVNTISAGTARIEVLLMFLSPFFLIFVIGKGFKAFKGILPILIVSAAAFTLPNFLIGNFLGPELPDIIGSICSMGITILLALVMKKREVPEEYRIHAEESSKLDLTAKEGVKAWSPFIVIFLLLILTSKLVPVINAPLSAIKSSFLIYTGEGGAQTSFSWINTPGVWIILAAIIGGMIQGAKIADILRIFISTITKNVKTIVTICAVLATAKIMVHSGMTTDVADVLAKVTGPAYPFFATWVGVLGAFVTGSGTNTAVLFGPLQSAAAVRVGTTPEWLIAANALGAGIGKMIAPSNVALSCAAAGIGGKENKVIRAVFQYVAIYAVIGGIICILFTL